ncbi:unnamed protein product [Chondrus crispus]|uniref:Uncharacterized protein n=1 Tax=Chondrus crispus TaxID=2769 RepID=R7QGL0_CHOCR|nr:unnamed protein product [Chondrus crispus]CDF36596.1 unnamed protein product [Chondrus crispus]|eukprot:XP_005716415.1 unnamed protein product [Chondrus crispus]
MSAETPPLEQLTATYTALAKELGNIGVPGLELIIDKANAKLFETVNDEIASTVSEIKAISEEGIEQLRDILAAVQALPDSLSETISALCKDICFSQYVPISFYITELVSSLQEVVQDPRVIFPRVPCGDMPVDPVLISRFKKRYYCVENLNQNDPNLKQSERSMPMVPESAMDVVVNVTSSFESITDDYLATAKALEQLSGGMQEIQDRFDTLRPAAEPILELLEMNGQINDVVSQLSMMMKTGIKSTSESPRSLKGQMNSDPVCQITEISCLFEKMGDLKQELEVSVARLRESSDLISSLIANLRDFLSVVLHRLTSILETARRLEANIPRIGRELREFFMPTGFKTLFLRPSATLLSILEGLENIKESLSKPLLDTAKAISSIEESDHVRSVLVVKNNVDELEQIPTKLVLVFQTLKTRQVISIAVEQVISQLRNELRVNVIATTATSLLQGSGLEHIANQVGGQLGF